MIFSIQPIRFLVAATLLAVVIQANAHGQMEKRSAEQYLTTEFLTSFPAVGSEIPELTVKNLQGEEVKLSSYLGKTTIMVKGGYT